MNIFCVCLVMITNRQGLVLENKHGTPRYAITHVRGVLGYKCAGHRDCVEIKSLFTSQAHWSPRL
jgi:hypothetical protein